MFTKNTKFSRTSTQYESFVTIHQKEDFHTHYCIGGLQFQNISFDDLKRILKNNHYPWIFINPFIKSFLNNLYTDSVQTLSKTNAFTKLLFLESTLF